MTAGGSLVLVLDLGGSRLKAGIVDVAAGTVAAFDTVPTAGCDADAALAAVHTTAKRLLDRFDVAAVGLSVPGIVDAGRITALPGKFDGIVGRDLAGDLAALLGRPTVVVNDAVAYGAGEALAGAGAGADRVVVVTIGTGVGVAVLQAGRPVAPGPLGGGILGGQIPIGEPDGPVDTSGRAGTIEARCRAEAIVVYANDSGGGYADVADVYAAAARGEQAALAGLATYRRWLARGLAALAHAHAPSVIVLGGGPVRPDSPILDDLGRLVAERLWEGYRLDIRPARLGDAAALLGLGHLALEARTTT